MRVDEGERPDRVRGVVRLGSGQVLAHVCLDELNAVHVRVGQNGTFVLGRGQLDAGDAGPVSLREMDGVVAGSGPDVQDAAARDVAKGFCTRPGPAPGRPAEPVGDGRSVTTGQLALAVDLPGPGVGVLGEHGASWVSGTENQVCVIR